MGTQCPRCCNCCSNCKECSISTQHLTRKKLLLMKQNMWVDADNFQQAVKMASSLEKRLNQDNLIEQYNQCIQVFIDRPCMREIPPAELP